jgi:hypothetical protein
MDNELREYLQAMEARLRDNAEQMETRLRDNAEQMETRLRDHTENVETKLLREFWKWARTADARYRENQGAVNGFAERLMIVEDRVAELERGDQDAA